MEKSDVEVYFKGKPFLIGIVALLFSFRFSREEKPEYIFNKAIEFIDEFEKRIRITK